MNFKIDNKQIEIFYSQTENKKLPVVLLNTYGDEGEEVWKECIRLKAKDFILVAISKLNWNDDMTPWNCPPLFKQDSECKGYADNHLNCIENKIIPKVREYIINILHKEIDYFGIAGYSLGGLFAVYSSFKTDKFKRIASASGSMWYPNFVEYVQENKISKNVDKIYFSLGNKEKYSKIEILRTVEEKTKKIQALLAQSTNSVYEENQGNHFQEGTVRMAKGIKWILE